MGLRSHLPPPEFFLSLKDAEERTMRIILFTDVEKLNTINSSEPNVQPLLGHTAPYVGQGSGSGLRWVVQAKINPWHTFLVGADGKGDGSRRENALEEHPYDELLWLERFMEDFGPSPLAVMHREGHDEMTVAITQFDSEISLSQSNPAEGERPSIIPVRMTLIERRDYMVRFE